MPEILSKRLVVLQPGNPCNNNKGLVSNLVNSKIKVKTSFIVVIVCIYITVTLYMEKHNYVLS